MKLINSSYQILEQEPGLDGIFKMIEKAGRTCYKSEDKITEDSAKKFVDMLISRGHTACLEQGTVYLLLPESSYGGEIHHHYILNPYSIANDDDFGRVYITTNYRVLYENGWLDDLQYLCEPMEHHAKRHTVRFICDRGVSHELVRHRVFSFAQESTRYCNYMLGKFGYQLTCIIPSWSTLKEGRLDTTRDGRDIWNSLQYVGVEFHGDGEYLIKDNFPKADMDFVYALQVAENMYINTQAHGWTPQQARQVLPNALKTEVVMTGFAKDWEHFFELRCANAAHPDMRALAVPLKEEFINRKYI